MAFTSNIPRGNQPKPAEGSALASPRASSSPAQAWKTARSMARQIDKVTSVVSQTRDRVARLHRTQATGNMHPFKIYQFPSSMRLFHNSDDWRRFKVRGGFVHRGAGAQSTNDVAFGSDQATYLGGNPFDDEYLRFESVPSDSTQINNAAAWHEIAVPADGNTYYFWYSTALFGLLSSGSSHGVLFGKAYTAATSMETGEVITDPHYTSFPAPDPYRQVIGSVTIFASNFNSVYAANVPYVEQIASADLWFPAAGSIGGTGSLGTAFRGTYSSSNWYYGGDVVIQDVDDGAGHITRGLYINAPAGGSTYPTALGPINAIDPASGDPWVLLSSSQKSASYVTGGYDGSKYYVRTP